MSQKKSEGISKIEDILKMISTKETKKIFAKNGYSIEVIEKKRRLNYLLDEAKESAVEIMRESKKLADSYYICYDDFEKLLTSMDNLLEYLSKALGNSNTMEDVRKMERDIIDPIVMEEGIDEGRKMAIDDIIKKLLDYGMSYAQIADITGVEKKYVDSIEK